MVHVTPFLVVVCNVGFNKFLRLPITDKLLFISSISPLTSVSSYTVSVNTAFSGTSDFTVWLPNCSDNAVKEVDCSSNLVPTAFASAGTPSSVNVESVNFKFTVLRFPTKGTLFIDGLFVKSL